MNEQLLDKRDDWACRVIQGLLASGNYLNYGSGNYQGRTHGVNEVVKLAYSIADEMLLESAEYKASF